MSETMMSEKCSGYFCMKYGFDIEDEDSLYSVLHDEQTGEIVLEEITYEGTIQ